MTDKIDDLEIIQDVNRGIYMDIKKLKQDCQPITNLKDKNSVMLVESRNTFT